MKNFLFFIKIFLCCFFLGLVQNLFAADWVPKKDFIEYGKKEHPAFYKIINGQQITYCIDGERSDFYKSINTFTLSSQGLIPADNNYEFFDVENALQKWFKNVLKRAKKYPNFEKEFADIIPILQAPKKMKRVSCGPNPAGYYENEHFLTQQKDYIFNSEKEDLRVVFSSQKSLNDYLQQNDYKESIIGFYAPFSDREIIWIAKQDILVDNSTLLHEFGHLFGFADISYGQEKQAEGYGSLSKKSIMAEKNFILTCDDADGLVAMIYLALGKDKVFRSFCDKNIFYHNGQILPMPTIEDFDNFYLSFDVQKIKTGL